MSLSKNDLLSEPNQDVVFISLDCIETCIEAQSMDSLPAGQQEGDGDVLYTFELNDAMQDSTYTFQYEVCPQNSYALAEPNQSELQVDEPDYILSEEQIVLLGEEQQEIKVAHEQKTKAAHEQELKAAHEQEMKAAHERETKAAYEQESMLKIEEEQIEEHHEEPSSDKEHDLAQHGGDAYQLANGVLKSEVSFAQFAHSFAHEDHAFNPAEIAVQQDKGSLYRSQALSMQHHNADMLQDDGANSPESASTLHDERESLGLHREVSLPEDKSSISHASHRNGVGVGSHSIAPTHVQFGGRTCRLIRLEYTRDPCRQLVRPSMMTLGTSSRRVVTSHAIVGGGSRVIIRPEEKPPQKKIGLKVKHFRGLNNELTLLSHRVSPETNGTFTKNHRPRPLSRKNEPSSTFGDVSRAWFTTKDEKKAFLHTGGRWKQGQWTKEEVECLQNNILQYCQDRSVSDPAEIIYAMTKDERKDFYRTIAAGLQRPLFSVYRRVLRMYDERNHLGKYSDDDIARLRLLRQKHGSNWSTIGNQLGRSASSVKDRCRLLNDTCNTGKWCTEEEDRLSAAVLRLSGAEPGESVTSGLSWAQVADHVGTRSEKQCRTKWLNYLNWKLQGGPEWGRQDDLLLLDRLSSNAALDEADINWVDIAADWPSVRSPQWLRGKWWTMKRHIADYGSVSFAKLIERLRCLYARGTRPDEMGSGLVKSGVSVLDTNQLDMSVGGQYAVISDEGVLITLPADSTTVANEDSTAEYIDVYSSTTPPNFIIGDFATIDQSDGSFLSDAHQSDGSFLNDPVQSTYLIDDQSGATYLNGDQSGSVYLIRSSDMGPAGIVYSLAEDLGESISDAGVLQSMDSCQSEQEIMSSDVIESDDPTTQLTSEEIAPLTPELTPELTPAGFSRSLSNDGAALVSHTDPLLACQSGED